MMRAELSQVVTSPLEAERRPRLFMDGMMLAKDKDYRKMTYALLSKLLLELIEIDEEKKRKKR